jgi:hypothetical protein
VKWKSESSTAKSLENGKRNAERTNGILWRGPDGRNYLIFASGKPPVYTYHLESPYFHAFIARPESKSSAPNVYVSIKAHGLWLNGVRDAIGMVERFVSNVIGKVERIQVSRCDLCADFHIPGGLSLNFLREHWVSRSTAQSQFLDGDTLETFYMGGAGAALRMRIYDKAKEIIAGQGEKLWFLEIWKLTECKDIWRVEFQLRREVLKQLAVNSIDELIERSAGIWKYLTEDWFSLRLADSPNTTRRSVHPFWQVVQDLRQDFGRQIDVAREYRGGAALVEWYVAHAAGCIVGFAARHGINDFGSALGFFADEMRKYWNGKDFDSRYEKERVKLGFDDTPQGVRDEQN